MHATFDKLGSTNYWTASSRTLRDVVEYFGPKTDQLDWSFQNGKVTFTSYTEKIQAGRGMPGDFALRFHSLTACRNP